jgi:hypothetical protein
MKPWIILSLSAFLLLPETGRAMFMQPHSIPLERIAGNTKAYLPKATIRWAASTISDLSTVRQPCPVLTRGMRTHSRKLRRTGWRATLSTWRSGSKRKGGRSRS